jgi:hypothetical protein
VTAGWGSLACDEKQRRQREDRAALARRTAPPRPERRTDLTPRIDVDGTPCVLAKEAAAALGISYMALWQRCKRCDFPHRMWHDGHRDRLCIPVAALADAAPPKPARWTEEEDEYLHEHLGVMPREAIARHLGRTDMAVLVRMTRLGISQADAKGWLTGGQVAEELGIHTMTLCYCVRRGDIVPQRYRPRSGNRRMYLFTQEEIERWIRRRITAPKPREQWDWRRMPRGYFRSFAADIAKGVTG